jgi:hypothetical protein
MKAVTTVGSKNPENRSSSNRRQTANVLNSSGEDGHRY